MTSVRSAYMEYDSLDKHNSYLEKRIRNESARYYQRKLIARPPPGRTLARSSQRLASRSYASSKYYNPNEIISRSSADGSALDSTSGISTPSTKMNRGPNRVDTGQSRMLAGIMGSSSILDPTSINTMEEEELLMDPEAAAGSEMKRFCLAVEHIVCAHLNRWRWKEGNEIMRNELPTTASSSKNGDKTRFSTGNSNSVDEEIDTKEDEDKLSVPLEQDDVRSRASSSASSIGTTSKTQANGSNTGRGPLLFPSLPKEYQWAHQPAEVSATSTLFTLDSASLHGDQNSGQLVQPDYHPDLILLCAPFVKCIRVETGMYFAFEKLMSMRGECNADIV